MDVLEITSTALIPDMDHDIDPESLKNEKICVVLQAQEESTNHLYFGDILLFKPDEVRTTNLTVQQGIQSIISAGAILPADLGVTPYKN
jgi:hypothetical protein